MKFIVVISLLVIALNCIGCSTIKSSISSENFNIENIRSLSIISEDYVIRKKKLVFSGEDTTVTMEFTNHFNSKLEEYFKKYSVIVSRIPDSLIVVKEKLLLENEIGQIIKSLSRKDRKNNIHLDVKLQTNLSKFVDVEISPFLVFIRVRGIYSTALHKALSYSPYAPYEPSEGMQLNFGIIHTRDNRLLWYSERFSLLSPRNSTNIEAYVKSLLFDLLYNQDVRPEAFLFNLTKRRKGNPITVYTKDKRKISGKILGFDVFEFIIEDREGEKHAISLKDTKKIRDRHKIYFPLRPLVFPEQFFSF